MNVAVDPWPGLQILAPAGEGNRNPVWQGRIGASLVAIRVSRRPAPSLQWELDLLGELARNDVVVPEVILTADGRRSVDGVVVQTWLDGRPPSSPADWRLVADELQRLHRLTADHPQRPGCCATPELASDRRSVDADLDRLPPAVATAIDDELARFDDVPRAVVHGDPGSSNIRIDRRGKVGLLDWDEARVDLTWHDLSNLGAQILDDDAHRRAQRLSHAWEAANAWIAEPEYARRRFEALLSARAGSQ